MLQATNITAAAGQELYEIIYQDFQRKYRSLSHPAYERDKP